RFYRKFLLPGFISQRVDVGNVEPGQRVIRRFRLRLPIDLQHRKQQAQMRQKNGEGIDIPARNALLHERDLVTSGEMLTGPQESLYRPDAERERTAGRV